MIGRAIALLGALTGEPASAEVSTGESSSAPLAVESAAASVVVVNADYSQAPGVEVPPAIEPRLAELAAAFHQATGKPLMITDGTRRPEVQAELMLRNLERGDDVVRNYANKSAARAVVEAYATARTAGRAAALAALTAVIQAQVAAGDFVSKHLREGAVDVRCHGLEKRERAILKRLAKARGIAVVDESRTSTPHYHLNFVR
ncbi:hypothetical protein [Nannocystis bainbridge]|uniref:Uncharacterized protein n=1 Tax=Nannocystis bainbridge TaxID=2995303 RepID=A0ABT5DRP6_9BACT|nr:hypothetical protein [Nannocystis bainbridge]MDC0715835.1 hypothetical protein [Nannocystis bainbridge]